MNKRNSSNKEVRITPRTDLIFKNIFGKKGNENILEDLLESILGERVKVKNIYKNEELDAENVYGKKAIIDIKAELKNDKIIDIEMQNGKYSYYDKRVLYYLSKLIISQVKSGEEYAKIKEVIVINILNYKIPKVKEYITKCHISNDNDYFVKGATVYFIQLPRFEEERKILNPSSKYEDIIKSKLDEWCIFLSDKNREVRDMAAKKNFNLEEAIRQYEELSSIPEVVEISFRRQMAEMDRKASERYAKEKGMAEGRRKGRREGREEGRAEGRTESKKEIAKNLLRQKVNMQIIINATGLTKEEIEKCS